MVTDVKLTQHVTQGGCGCKIAPDVLRQIILGRQEFCSPQVIVGNDHNDDAAVYDIDGKTGIVSTTDFFTPIVDDPQKFGEIAAANALSDVYAMGGTPFMALSILGWPISKLPSEVAREVLAGARRVCDAAKVSLCGGHSISSVEPIFGLAVTGKVPLSRLKQNGITSIDRNYSLFLTKPLGTGIIMAAARKGIADASHVAAATACMCQLNEIGVVFGGSADVGAMTDVTGFGLLGHLLEMCSASGASAKINFDKLPLLEGVLEYAEKDCLPGGQRRNWTAFKDRAKQADGATPSSLQAAILCDPQTSGGLLVAVEEKKEAQFLNLISGFPLVRKIGCLFPEALEPIVTVL